ADQRLYEQVACLMERLSPHAHDMLGERGSRLGGIELPSPDACAITSGARRPARPLPGSVVLGAGSSKVAAGPAASDRAWSGNQFFMRQRRNGISTDAKPSAILRCGCDSYGLKPPARYQPGPRGMEIGAAILVRLRACCRNVCILSAR